MLNFIDIHILSRVFCLLDDINVIKKPIYMSFLDFPADQNWRNRPERHCGKCDAKVSKALKLVKLMIKSCRYIHVHLDILKHINIIF